MKARKNTAGTFIRVLIIIVLAVLIGGVLLFNFFFKTDGSPASVFGLYFLRTNEVYMENEIMPGDMIIAVKTDPADLAPSDVVICQFRERITIMRIIAVGEGEPLTFSVKYDTAPETDAFVISADNIIAKAEYKDAVMGKLLDIATSVPGIIVAVIIPLTLIIIYQITRFAAGREDPDEEELDAGEGIIRRQPEKTVSERTADLEELLSERELDDPAISLKDFSSAHETPGLASTGKAAQKAVDIKKLSIDERGKAVIETTRAEYEAARRADLEATKQIALTAYAKNTPEPVKTYEPVRPAERYTERHADPVVFIKPEPLRQTENVTRIGDLARASDTSADEAAARELLRPKPVSVIPESINRVQQEASRTAPAGFDDSVREYYNKTETAEAFAEPASQTFIPKNAAVPKENLSPVKRKNSSRTIDELMKIIDSESGKITK
jgi:hypothetical protein